MIWSVVFRHLNKFDLLTVWFDKLDKNPPVAENQINWIYWEITDYEATNRLGLAFCLQWYK